MFTAAELAERAGFSVARAEWILRGFAQSGIVERAVDGWQATSRGLALSMALCEEGAT